MSRALLVGELGDCDCEGDTKRLPSLSPRLGVFTRLLLAVFASNRAALAKAFSSCAAILAARAASRLWVTAPCNMSNHWGALSKVAAFAARAMGVVRVPETAFRLAPWFTREAAAAK